jgi:hypothetical protein
VRPVREADVTAICETIVQIIRDSQHLTAL